MAQKMLSSPNYSKRSVMMDEQDNSCDALV